MEKDAKTEMQIKLCEVLCLLNEMEINIDLKTVIKQSLLKMIEAVTFKQKDN